MTKLMTVKNEKTYNLKWIESAGWPSDLENARIHVHLEDENDEQPPNVGLGQPEFPARIVYNYVDFCAWVAAVLGVRFTCAQVEAAPSEWEGKVAWLKFLRHHLNQS